MYPVLRLAPPDQFDRRVGDAVSSSKGLAPSWFGADGEDVTRDQFPSRPPLRRLVGHVVPVSPADEVAGVDAGRVVTGVHDEAVFFWDRAVEHLEHDTGDSDARLVLPAATDDAVPVLAPVARPLPALVGEPLGESASDALWQARSFLHGDRCVHILPQPVARVVGRAVREGAAVPSRAITSEMGANIGGILDRGPSRTYRTIHLGASHPARVVRFAIALRAVIALAPRMGTRFFMSHMVILAGGSR